MKRSDFRALLDRHLVVCDGAMGSQIYEQMGSVRSVEEVNLLQPEGVFRIHLSYLQAGARLIETNTFGANRWKLAALGLADKLVAINHAAVKVAREAREAAGTDALIAGSIGPLGRTWWLEETDAARRGGLAEQARSVFREQAQALEERGIDLFILETFPSRQELEWAVEAVRSFSQLPIVAQLAYNDEGKTLVGDDALEATRRLLELDLDAVGANCGIGPQDMLGVLQRLSVLDGARLSALPNVGFPRRAGDRVIYPRATPEYFAEFAREAATLRAGIIGGCCGTTPQHIRAIAEAVKAASSRPAAAKTRPATAIAEPAAVPPPAPPPTAAEPVSKLYAKLKAGRFAVSVELDPPKGVHLERILEAVERFRASGAVDAVDINSGTLARLGMDAIMLAVAIERAGLETIPHLTTRDLNVIGLQAVLLGAWSVGGVRNVLAITGDPPSLGDHPQVTGIYEVDAVGLVRILHRLNQGYDWAGKALGGATNFAIGVAVNPTADDLDDEIRRFRLKIEAGAHFAMTQPIFEPAQWERFLERLGGPPSVPVLLGIWPLSSLRLAVRLNNEVPGISIPDSVLKRLEAAGPRARDEGFALARELFAWARTASASNVRGAYLIPPFKKYEEALEVIG